MIFFKDNPNAQVLQLSYIVQAVQCIPCESGNGLDNDHVNLSYSCPLQHFLKLRSVFAITGDALVYLIAYFDTILFSPYFFILPPRGFKCENRQ